MAIIHWLQHVPFEGLGSMEEWLVGQGHELRCTRLWAGDQLPALDDFSALIVMGGPMGIYDYDEYSWLKDEKTFLQDVVEKKIPVLGICLGAQLLADVLGADVTANPEKEIGWFPVRRTADVPPSLQPVLPEEFVVFHWHGDTFSLPPHAVSLYSSTACKNQAFLYKKHVIGLQFHLETTANSAAALVENCRNELLPAPWIQAEDEILQDSDIFQKNNRVMHQLLDTLFFCP